MYEINLNYLESDELYTSSIFLQVLALWPVFPQVLQLCTPAFPSFPPTPLECFSCFICSVTSLWDRISCASLTVITPPACMHVFLALQRLLRASFACQSVQTSAAIKVISWAKSSVPFANAFTVWKIRVGELPWCHTIQSLTKVDCERASAAL